MSPLILDYLLTVLHLVIIGLNLFAWIWPKTRKLHLYVIGITLACWLILGIWYGLGYCPITDWQWQVKTKLGETNLPNSFVKYHLDQLTGRNIPDGTVDLITSGSFLIAIVYSVKVNFLQKTFLK
ncbi:DUF2784 domain-containing protein [Pedobacter chitinilyticus]|uniref:DUF2784 domain-containing protein n=1 Tax=Pedobacter chitinilyticus TaxID=2233776 RepID=A0A3S3SRL0_9SPHI|nr:DUF2784 domain-containing protein [Pedobacter chitinilyticus]RWU07521.1 DUF2784 domain-containing protein [Pedobacter chitinilyticus]